MLKALHLKTYLTALILSVLLVSSPALSKTSDELAQGKITPMAVAKVLQDLNLSYQSKFDKDNNPRMIVTNNSLPSEQFEIYFFDCINEIECQSITLWSWYKPLIGINYARSNIWNRKNRFLKSYLDGDFNPVLEMDIQSFGGIGPVNLKTLITAYVSAIPVYADYMKVNSLE
ncbi:MAG: hypothetical protein CMP22_03990 [Rickettsiales bacterium]|nr:hypothetical protein [Rickettsiales bacterium]|tara:strand:- start:196 stop:714 length:519 start_codon:yes stop_codon:yes gene_type:complete